MDVVSANPVSPIAAATPPLRSAAGDTGFATKLERALAGVTPASNQAVPARLDVAHAGVKADGDAKADAAEPVVADASAAQSPPPSATNPVAVAPVVLPPVLLDVPPDSVSPMSVAADAVPALDPGAAGRAAEVASVANIQTSFAVDSPEKTSPENNSGAISDQRTNESGRFSDQPIQDGSDLFSESAATTTLNGADVDPRAAEFEVTRATTLSTYTEAVSNHPAQFRGAQDGSVVAESVVSLTAEIPGMAVTSVLVASTGATEDAAPQPVVDDSAIDGSARKNGGDRPIPQAAGAISEKAPASTMSDTIHQQKSEFAGLPPVSSDTRGAERNRPTAAAGNATTDTTAQGTLSAVSAAPVTHSASELKPTIVPPAAQPAVMRAETKAQPQTPPATQGTIQPNVKNGSTPAPHAKNESSPRTSNATDVQPNLRPEASQVVPPDPAVVAASVSAPAPADVPAQSAAVAVAPAVHTNPPQPASSSDRGASSLSPVLQDVSPPPVLPNSVTAAHLVERAASSEMQVGVRTEMFGGVVLHTSLRDGDLGVAIGSERGNLANVLAHDNAALQDALARNNIRLEDVRFFDLSGGASGFAGNSHAGTFTPQPHSSRWFTAGESVNEVTETDAQPVLSRPGLSVLA